MDKQMYKQLVATLMRKESKLKEELRKSNKQVLELTIENANLKDELKNYNCYAETDGLEVGSPSDYEIDKQLNLFDDQ